MKLPTTNAVQMPARGDRGAPQFDSTKPCELHRYFNDLEFHFTRSGVTDEAEKKRHATRFLSVDDQDIWEALEEFSTATKSYAEFKDVISTRSLESMLELAFYPKATTPFYRQFLVITRYLLAKQRLSQAEQSRSFCRAIAPASLRDRVNQRLQIKKTRCPP
ncbi:hypothetical protein B0H13DRAFT_1851952 [Mycena leptocephala]|nr:hypothetical protein B0H13DRAFT_1851952 [Mycena leptocephala]